MPQPSTTEAHLEFAWQVTQQDMAAPGTGDWIEVGPGTCTVTIIPAGGSSKVQYTTSRPSRVRAGTATAIDWANGSVSVPTSDIPQGPITGVRPVCVSGSCSMEVVQ